VGLAEEFAVESGIVSEFENGGAVSTLEAGLVVVLRVSHHLLCHIECLVADVTAVGNGLDPDTGSLGLGLPTYFLGAVFGDRLGVDVLLLLEVDGTVERSWYGCLRRLLTLCCCVSEGLFAVHVGADV